MSLKTVYHPETNEPFEVTPQRWEKLVLEKGWNQTPIDKHAEPAVQTVEKTRRVRKLPVVPDEVVENIELDNEDWRGTTGKDEDEG